MLRSTLLNMKTIVSPYIHKYWWILNLTCKPPQRCPVQSERTTTAAVVVPNHRSPMEHPTRRKRPLCCSVFFLIAAIDIQQAASLYVVPPSIVANAWLLHPTRSGRSLHHQDIKPYVMRRHSCSREKAQGGWTDKAESEGPGICLRINGQTDIEKLLEPSEGVVGSYELPSQADDREQAYALEFQSRQGKRLNKNTPVVPRSLESVRDTLVRQEETIIFSLIERGQFRQNSDIYSKRTFRLNKPGADDIYGRDASFLEYLLCETEKLHSTGAFPGLLRSVRTNFCYIFFFSFSSDFDCKIEIANFEFYLLPAVEPQIDSTPLSLDAAIAQP